MVGEIKNKANSAQLELELGLSLAKVDESRRVWKSWKQEEEIRG